MSRDAAILGMTLSNVTENELVEIHAAIIAGLETSVLQPVVGRELPLADAARAHHAMTEPGVFGKTVLLTWATTSAGNGGQGTTASLACAAIVAL
jgi:NADPH2:quinone reductase